MRAGRVLAWSIVALALLLCSCGGATYEEEPTVDPREADGPTSTPIVAFDLSPAATSEPSGSSTVYLQPSVVNLAVGETQTVKIWVDGARGLNRILLELSFDPDYVSVEDADPQAEGVQVTPGEVPEPVDVAQNQVTADDPGWIRYEVAGEPGAGVDGSGIVASVTLRVVAEGASPLRWENAAALDPGGNALDVMVLADGLVTVAGEVEVQPTAQPTSAPATEPPATAQPTVQPTAQPTSAPAPVSGGGIYYVVQPGENLFRVGLKFGTTAQAIADASNLGDPRQIQAGTMVLVPVPPPQGGYAYYVQPGDTIYSVGRRFGMTVEEVATLNGIGADYQIGVGLILAVTP
jgi:LysM repeat protein